MEYQLRPAAPGDTSVLGEMLYYAAQLELEGEREFDVVYRHAALQKYVLGWGRAGDSGVVGCAEGSAVGAAWLRVFAPGEQSFASLPAGLPELAIGIRPAWRGGGLGGALLATLVEQSRGRYPGIALSVRAENPAQRLYLRHGFQLVERMRNRLGGESLVMLLSL